MNIDKKLVLAKQHLRERKIEQAKTICHKILKEMPVNIEASFLLGSAHQMQLNFAESRKMFEKVLSLNPEHLNANNDLGVIFMDQKDYSSAEKFFRKVIEIDPCHVNALINMGNIYYNLNQFESAESLYQKVLTLAPDNAEVLNNLGQLFITQRRITEWLELMKKIASLSTPGSSMFVAYLGAKKICQWDIADKFRSAIINVMMMGSLNSTELGAITLPMLSDSTIDNQTMFHIVCKTADAFEKRCLSKFRNHEIAFRALKSREKMRIGYLSGDFYQHVCTNYLASMIDCYDKSRFEVFCYSNTAIEDDITRKYKSNVDAFIDIRQLSDLQLANRIHEDGVHILVDLSGYTLDSRVSVMCYRAAPLQITYMGYPFSTGFRSIDHIIVDPYLDGPLNAKYCTETPLRLPEAAAASGALFEEEINPVPPFERCGQVSFGSLINTYKLNPDLIRVWSQILKKTPGTKIILNHPNYEPEITRHNIIKEFAIHGIYEDRVQFIWQRLTNASHLYYYNDIDIALDVFPMTGGQTTIDALWMGVPVITLVGETQRERITYGLLNNITKDIEDIIADTKEQYIQKAVALANNPSRIASLHQIILEGLNRSILFDPERFTWQLESTYIDAWNNKFPENQFNPRRLNKTEEIVSLRDGTQIAVSSSIDDRYAYIVKEQKGWFDPEYDFLINLIQPDMRVIDIASEVGVYAVPWAKKMTDSGGVWAISTNFAHTRYLLKSKNINELKSLKIIENIRLGNFNIDRDMIRHNWSDIDFVRINVNGGEQGLFRRGKTFFSESSPLVMFGTKHKEERNLAFVKLFEEQGYASYRFIPGLNLLVPFDSKNELNELDDFSLHLFCCKEDRAEQLENRGLLMQQLPPMSTLPCFDPSVLQQYLSDLPYAKGVMSHWSNVSSQQKGWETYLQALSLFAAAKTETQDASFRYACMQGTLQLLGNLLADQANVSRVLSMARVLTDMGKRSLAVKVLDHLSQFLETGTGEIVMSIDEPFLALSDSFASVNPGDRIAEWIYASILEEREKLRAFSSYYTGKESLVILDKIEGQGFLNDEMKRRRQLIRMRHRMDVASHDAL